ncbi:hypothetical protein E3P77_01825 [Wallemia ichthyophaga]|uniref:ABC transporter domain-containing protein n=1 Tax=Wallemia ichthyophaga TaxID=245174 RepID=A0A4T0GEW4_WALIC|nr:hypothetical protein E3P95_01845 [Wallemia ichthyophaga]TIB01273.1 hypothetical protein E3P94_01877 [Wallemia ichthyophaga]TIB12322.1 hypothetical protein E3P90_02074 [Wallemia ichthyophaga]TIB13569.1 hypothetical protein E3P93_01911 [Wallemia ichthyophaga]TIB22501.1 hypothetical protein E3P89_02011 [Wallemia ichthyophaga]
MPAYFHANKCLFYALGNTTKNSQPLFNTPLSWSLESKRANHDAWAIIGPQSTRLIKALFKQSDKSVPATALSHPLADSAKCYPWETYSIANFSTRLLSSADGFVDYTARYGSLRGDETQTVLSYLMNRVPRNGSNTESDTDDKVLAFVAEIAHKLDLKKLLDRPLIGLSNGQSRRLKIAHALLLRRSLLVLEEPYTGLDPPSRARLSQLLETLHRSMSPNVLLLLKPSDSLPDYITHVLQINDDGVIQSGPKDEVLSVLHSDTETTPDGAGLGCVQNAKVLIDLKDVNISYRKTPVLNNIHWQVRAGERWHLQGYNANTGSGKTYPSCVSSYSFQTLLSLVTGDHPQSYTKDITLFDKPRARIATTQLSTLIGTTSPEISSSFPRSTTLTAFDVVATGYMGVYCFRPTRDEGEKTRVYQILRELAPAVDPSASFTTLSQSEKSCLFLARALVNRSPLLILDEPFQGMTAQDVYRSRMYLQTQLGSEQAVVFVTHYETEVPWKIDQGRYIRLRDGFVEKIH